MDRENRNRKSWYSVLGSFLARRWAGLLLFLVCAGIFALVFSLYDLGSSDQNPHLGHADDA